MEQLATLYQVDGTTVFYSTTSTTQIKTDSVCTDVFGKTITTAQAKYDRSNMQAIPTPRNKVEQIYRNICIGPVIISVVRTELIECANPTEYLEKLQTAIGLVQVGLFAEARLFILSLIPDEELTDTQLTRWAALLESADAITEEEVTETE